MKETFDLSDNEVYEEIMFDADKMKNRLKNKKISYDSLKLALIPNQDKDRYEICFVFDSTLIDSCDYGNFIFSMLITLLDKESTYSIKMGDYINLLDETNSGWILYSAMNEVLERVHESNFQSAGQYFLVYINRLTREQRQRIVQGIECFSWFTGYANLTHQSRFKSYISYILSPLCVKNKSKIIMSHPSDYQDEENINMLGYPFEENQFQVVSINEESFGPFLEYKIESELPDESDVSFSFNALFPKFDSFKNISFQVSDNKWSNYLVNKAKGKGDLVQILGYGVEEKEQFAKAVFKQVCGNYIYNLRKNEYDDLLFNVCVELTTVNGNKRKTTIALKYFPETGTVEVITIT